MCFYKYSKLATVKMAVLCGLLSTAAFAQNSPDDVIKNLPRGTVKYIRANPEGTFKRMVEFALRISDDGSVTQNDLDNMILVEKAEARSRYLSQILKMDLNADGVVSKEEFSLIIKYQRSRAQPESVVARKDADTDRDGEISFKEMLAYAVIKTDIKLGGRRDRQGILYEIMLMDVNGDGKTTIDELTEVIDAVAK